MTAPTAASPGPRPSVDVALRLIRERFVNRADMVAIRAPWGKPCPTEPRDLEALLRGHLLGAKAPPCTVKLETRHGTGFERGTFRVGVYAPDKVGLTRWLCVDFDGAGHSAALAEPLVVALTTAQCFEAAGFTPYLERSGGGKGWHVWVFFDPPIAAEDARRLGYAAIPTTALLTTGEPADVRSARGIELFPKQARITEGGGKGNMVWLPFWALAQDGGNAFYRRVAGGGPLDVEAYVPDELSAAGADVVAGAFASLAAVAPVASEPLPAPSSQSSSPRPSAVAGTADPEFDAWRSDALRQLRLEDVYGRWLTGEAAGEGWLECRDPSSPSGDENPSASVALGSGEAERGSWHSFRTGETLSVFDFLQRFGGCADYRAARDEVARLSGVAPPRRAPPPATDADLAAAEELAAFLDERPAAAAIVEVRAEASVARFEPPPLSFEPGEPIPLPLDEPRPPGPPRPRQLPKIQINARQLRYVVNDAWSAVLAANKPPRLFRRGEELVRLAPGSKTGVRIAAMDVDATFGLIIRTADWVRSTEEHGDVAVSPPHDVARDMLAYPRTELPELEGVVSAPVVDAEGELVTAPGYNAGARLWYQREPGAPPVTVPKAPSQAQRDAARALLLDDLLVDFPFTAESDKAHAAAAMLLPFARRLIHDATPLHLFEAPSPGSGKGLLSDLVFLPATGTTAEATTITEDEDEARKKITSVLSKAPPIVLLDNVRGGLDSAQLASAITTATWSDRSLGTNRMVEYPNRAVWLVTANNPTLSLEIARRTVRIRIDAKQDRPWQRTGFRHPDLRRWAREHRWRIVEALLTLIRAWVAEGRPAGPRSLGSFEAWATTIGGILEVARVPGFLGDLEQLYEAADEEGASWREFVAAWWNALGPQEVGGGALLTVARNGDLLTSVIGQGNDKSQRIRLGRALGQMRDRVFGGFRISVGQDLKAKALTYRLVRGEERQEAQQTFPEPGWDG